MDPGENRLTASFAAVLERVDSLAATLVADWIGEQPSEPVWVRTQRATVGGRFVDLELCFGSPVAPELRVWVEVKHGADLHELQLENYAEDLALETQGRSQLVLLAPRDAMPAVSPGAIAVEWQQLGRRLLGVRKAFASGSADAWLVDELVRYLKEEGLSDQEALTPADVFVLSARPAADRAFGRLVELAHQHVLVELWPGLPDPSKTGGTFGPGWWAAFDPSLSGETPATWRSGWFEWTLREDSPREESRGGYAFFAGAAFQSMKDSPLAASGNESWLATLSADGFERIQAGYYWRLWRVLYPEELMSEATLDSQARKLAKWVAASFRSLAGQPPPH